MLEVSAMNASVRMNGSIHVLDARMLYVISMRILHDHIKMKVVHMYVTVVISYAWKHTDGNSGVIMNDSKKSLTARETEVLHLLAQGMCNAKIAEILVVGERSIQEYVRRIMRRTGIHNRVLLAFYAFREGYVTNAEIKDAIELERQKQT